jgi:hypothetical protein
LLLKLRGWAGDRQIPNLSYALQHNVGLGGAVVVGIYKKAFPGKADPTARFGYVGIRWLVRRFAVANSIVDLLRTLPSSPGTSRKPISRRLSRARAVLLETGTALILPLPASFERASRFRVLETSVESGVRKVRSS